MKFSVFNFLWKDFRLLKISFIIIGAYFLYDEFKLLIVDKPTIITVTRSRLAPHHFPDIWVCPLRGYDEQELRKIGFNNSRDYTIGSYGDRNHVGWLGNTTGLTTGDIIRRISTIKTTDDCPSVLAKFEIRGMLEIRSFPNSTLTRPIHPNGRCCRPKPPQMTEVHPIYELQIMSKEATKFSGFRVILSNPLTASIFEQNKFQSEGINMDSPSDSAGIHSLPWLAIH